MAAAQWAMRQPIGAVPYSPQEVAIAETQAAKQTVPYENSGQTPPTQQGTSSIIPKALQAFVGVVLLLIAGCFFYHKAMKAEGVAYDGERSGDGGVSASAEVAVG